MKWQGLAIFVAFTPINELKYLRLKGKESEIIRAELSRLVRSSGPPALNPMFIGGVFFLLEPDQGMFAVQMRIIHSTVLSEPGITLTPSVLDGMGKITH